MNEIVELLQKFRKAYGSSEEDKSALRNRNTELEACVRPLESEVVAARATPLTPRAPRSTDELNVVLRRDVYEMGTIASMVNQSRQSAPPPPGVWIVPARDVPASPPKDDVRRVSPTRSVRGCGRPPQWRFT